MTQPPPIPTPPPFPTPTRPPRSPAGAFAAFFMLACTAISADVLWHGLLYQHDAAIARRLYRLMVHSPRAIDLCASLARLGDRPFSLAVGLIVAIVLLVLGRGRLLTVWVVGLLGSGLLGIVMNAHFAEPRTFLFALIPQDDTFSYPSTQTMAAATIFGLLAYLLICESPRLKWLWTLLATALTLTVAASLMLLGLHYLTDILGALTLASGWLFLVIALFGPQRQSPKPPQPGFPVVT